MIVNFPTLSHGHSGPVVAHPGHIVVKPTKTGETFIHIQSQETYWEPLLPTNIYSNILCSYG